MFFRLFLQYSNAVRDWTRPESIYPLLLKCVGLQSEVPKNEENPFKRTHLFLLAQNRTCFCDFSFHDAIFNAAFTCRYLVLIERLRFDGEYVGRK